jgi:hypothetical protein
MCRRLSMTIVVIILTGFLAGPAAAADDNACWLEARQSLYLSIYDLDSQGSILSHMWEGVLDQGSKKRIISSNGKIRYYTNPGSESSSPGINLMCHNNEIISVP